MTRFIHPKRDTTRHRTGLGDVLGRGRRATGPEVLRWESAMRQSRMKRSSGIGLSVLAAAFCVALAVPAVAQSPFATQEPLPDEVWQNMQGKSWHPGMGCPRRQDLVLLTLPFHDFAGKPRTGRMIVNRSVARPVMQIFEELYLTDFRIAGMRLIDDFGGNDNASMEANNTSAFNCRKVTSGRSKSAHAEGLAIDINPRQNPYVRGPLTLPPSAGDLDEAAERDAIKETGLVEADGAVVGIFLKNGWKWGGNWRSLKDYQHFSANGR